MTDPTEDIRRQELVEINSHPGSREDLEARHGQVWDTSELQRDFVVEGFLAPYVVVRRKSDGVRGSMQFQHSPRLYFGFEPEWSAFDRPTPPLAGWALLTPLTCTLSSKPGRRTSQ